MYFAKMHGSMVTNTKSLVFHLTFGSCCDG